MAKANVMIDNQKTRVTEWSFEVGDSTGQHIHEYDYVVVPLLDGELKIVNHDGEETISKLAKGGSTLEKRELTTMYLITMILFINLLR